MNEKPLGEALIILLIEDNDAHAKLVIRSLGQHQITNQIYHISDGETALRYLFREGEYSDPATSPRPHLVLLDLRLPRIDGLTVLQQIKQSKLSTIPVVVLTTSSAKNDVIAAYQNQANSYLVKPTNFDTFSQMMRELGFYWLAWNHHPWKD